MRCLTRCVTRVVAVSLLLLAPASTAPWQEPAARPGPAAPAEDPLPRCCFTNSRYAGTCEVVPTRDESCGQILDYLNNPMSQGKSYCGNTQIRGGWHSVACEPLK
jgi:hypothetical protein